MQFRTLGQNWFVFGPSGGLWNNHRQLPNVEPGSAAVLKLAQSGSEWLKLAMTDFIDSDGFRANVGIVLMRDDRQVFLGGRPGGRGWQFPQGGIAQHEAPEEALFRELKEEIGLEAAEVEVVASTRSWLRYRLPKQYMRRQSTPLCIGQKQRWFLLRVRSDNQAFKFDTTSQPEFDSWRWADYWTPVREVIYFKRAVYARALDELARRAFPHDLPELPEWWRDDRNLRAVVKRREQVPGNGGGLGSSN